LDFQMRITVPPVQPDATPLPEATPETAAALAAVQAATVAAAAPPRDLTPQPGTLVKQPGGSKEHKPFVPPTPTRAQEISDQDRIAAILLSLESEEVPEGSTVADVPALKTVSSEETKAEGDSGKKPEKKMPTREEMSNAANEALRRIMRRPR
ncbi:MAG: hypothetical protein NZ703_08570, partial [Gemmataceae bacterium]|nr:hypothetical protein [Gemmataceae bacterium]